MATPITFDKSITENQFTEEQKKKKKKETRSKHPKGADYYCILNHHYVNLNIYMNVV